MPTLVTVTGLGGSFRGLPDGCPETESQSRASSRDARVCTVATEKGLTADSDYTSVT